ncbi:MAG: hypothetical protein COC17_06390 [Hyphomicrobiales bacterium]|nr:anti-sigma factor [Hyphomicrobiales bacterium]PCH50013.1 MAG: hypothetical protein COC17_06390 [Hyphomicrobiales bacterium]
MTAHNDKFQSLSAYLDGELSPSQMRTIDKQLETDSAMRAEFETLMDADLIVKSQLENMLTQPIPMSLAQKIKSTPLGTNAASTSHSLSNFQAIAASIALLAIGSVGGYFIKDYFSNTPILTAQISMEQNWINEIADYHAVYAKQKRHLVEVKASDKDHLTKWLSKSLEHDFNVPDFSAKGLTFEGARLLVVGGKPVAQLIYTLEGGEVVALCIQNRTQTRMPSTSKPFNDSINGFDFFYWEHGGVDLVLIGNKGFGDFGPLAKSTNNQI